MVREADRWFIVGAGLFTAMVAPLELQGQGFRVFQSSGEETGRLVEARVEVSDSSGVRLLDVTVPQWERDQLSPLPESTGFPLQLTGSSRSTEGIILSGRRIALLRPGHRDLSVFSFEGTVMWSREVRSAEEAWPPPSVIPRGDSLLVLDPAGPRVFLLDTDGAIVRSRAPSMTGNAVPRQLLVATGAGFFLRSEAAAAEAGSAALEHTVTFHPWETGPAAVVLELEDAGSLFAADRDRIIVLENQSGRLRVFDHSGRPQTVIRWSPEGTRFIHVRVDERGALWLGEITGRWLSLSAEGYWVTVSVGEAAQVLDVSREGILTLRHTEDSERISLLKALYPGRPLR